MHFRFLSIALLLTTAIPSLTYYEAGREGLPGRRTGGGTRWTPEPQTSLRFVPGSLPPVMTESQSEL